MRGKDLKLKFELLPMPCHKKNLRYSIPLSRWKAIRNKVFEKSGRACEICGWKRNLRCHEVWEYDDKKHVQRLSRLATLCAYCHEVKHFTSLAIVYGRNDYIIRGRKNLEDLIKHFMKVNGVGKKRFQEHEYEAYIQLEERNNHQWKTDFGKYEVLIYKRNNDNTKKRIKIDFKYEVYQLIKDMADQSCMPMKNFLEILIDIAYKKGGKVDHKDFGILPQIGRIKHSTNKEGIIKRFYMDLNEDTYEFIRTMAFKNRVHMKRYVENIIRNAYEGLVLLNKSKN